MPGATADILLPDLNDGVLATWREIISRLSETRNGKEFWILPSSPNPEPALPFFWGSQHSSDELWISQGLPEAVETIRMAFGFVPTASIFFGAMCRGRPSDCILARLAAEFLNRQTEALLFHGLLNESLDPDVWTARRTPQKYAADFASRIGSLGGRLVTISVEDDPTYHVVDRTFLDAWTRRGAFHFIN